MTQRKARAGARKLFPEPPAIKPYNLYQPDEWVRLFVDTREELNGVGDAGRKPLIIEAFDKIISKGLVQRPNPADAWKRGPNERI